MSTLLVEITPVPLDTVPIKHTRSDALTPTHITNTYSAITSVTDGRMGGKDVKVCKRNY